MHESGKLLDSEQIQVVADIVDFAHTFQSTPYVDPYKIRYAVQFTLLRAFMSSEESTIRGRVVAFVVHITKASTARYKEMEKATGINAEKWQNLAAKKQRVTEEMLDAIGRVWPSYSYWVMTGLSDYEHEHLDPGYEEWIDKRARYSQSDQIILTRPPVSETLNTYPIEAKIRATTKKKGVPFDWGVLNEGSIELAANILFQYGLNEANAVALAEQFAKEVLVPQPKAATMIAEAQVRDWIKQNF